MKELRSFDIFLLPTLRTTAEPHKQVIPIFRKVDSVTRTPIDDVFTDARIPFHARRVAELHAQLGSDNLCSSLGI